MEVKIYPIVTSEVEGVCGQHHTPSTLLLAKTRYLLYRRLGGPQGQSARVQKIPPPPRFDPRPVASHYTDWAILTPDMYWYLSKILRMVVDGLCSLYTEILSALGLDWFTSLQSFPAGWSSTFKPFPLCILYIGQAYYLLTKSIV
jgi:hypothetical protein